MEESAVEQSQDQGASSKVGRGPKLWLTSEAMERGHIKANQAAAIVIITLASIIAFTDVLSLPKLTKSITAADDKTSWALFIVLMIFTILACFILGFLNLVPSEKEEEAQGLMVV